MSNIQKYKDDLEKLINLGNKMENNVVLRVSGEEDVAKKEEITLEKSYQRWYTESLLVIKQLLPDRLTEFQQLYRGDGRRDRFDGTTFNIQDWMKGFRANTNSFGKKGFNDLTIVGMLLRNQLDILRSAKSRLESRIFDIKHLVQADLFDSELDAARELASRGFLRAAGVVAGVVLERHLIQVVDNHNINTHKDNPTIGDFNDLLKDDGVLEIPSWRQIQRFGDIRNLCAHSKQREPTKDEVDELISGVEKYTKALF